MLTVCQEKCLKGENECAESTNSMTHVREIEGMGFNQI
jgi:hypothetical protein